MTGSSPDIQSYEKVVFKYCLKFAVLFMVLRVLHNVFLELDASVIFINLLTIGILIGLMWFYKTHFQVCLLTMYGLLICLLIISWNSFGGWTGTVPFSYMSILIFVIITSHGWLRLLIIGVFIILIFGIDYIYKSDAIIPIDVNTLSFNFLINIIILSGPIYFFKNEFFKRRKQIEATNNELKKEEQRHSYLENMLHSQKSDLEALKEQKELLLKSKKEKTSAAIQTLKNYSFANSHFVKNPISQIRLMINLIKMDDPERNTILNKIYQKTDQLNILIDELSESIRNDHTIKGN
ncbi:hypothetical protein SAMN05421640_1284 [Ekhidna lutea]|uniref:Histidine kinase n=2 Tax=Ekhidna lutea TaxID=447679 RepID=A0A239HF73_EKHLU|nr:hypothetical protein SAMN05421640_1284 [Ekhidna lutea]